MKKLAALLALLLSGCVGIPANVQPVGDFELDRYLAPGTKSPGWITPSNGPAAG